MPDLKTYACAQHLIYTLKRGKTACLVSPTYESAAQVMKIVREALGQPEGPIPGLTVQVDE